MHAVNASFLDLPAANQAVVEALDQRIVASSDEGAHVQSGAHGCSPAPDETHPCSTESAHQARQRLRRPPLALRLSGRPARPAPAPLQVKGRIRLTRFDSTYLAKEKLKPGFHFLTASAIGRTGE